MNRNRVVLASIASLAFGIICEVAETGFACDSCRSRVTTSTYYPPSYPPTNVVSDSACCVPACSTICCQPVCPIVCCRPICPPPCCPTTCCPTACAPTCCPRTGSSNGYEPTYAPQGNYEPTTSQYGLILRPSPARTSYIQRPSAAVAQSRGAATQVVKSAPTPSPARVVKQEPAHAPLATVRTAAASQPSARNSGWTVVPAPKLASNR
jgi:hypothetical protein